MKITKTESGMYHCQIYIGDEVVGGKKKKIRKSITAPTYRECEQIARRLSAQGINAIRLGDVTVQQALRRYIDSKKNVLSPSTISGYEGQYRIAYTDINNIKVRDLTLETLQMWLNILSVNHSKKTCKNIVGLLSSACKMFESDIPFDRLTYKDEIKEEPYIPTLDEVWTLYGVTDNENMRKAILLSAFCSLRRSEACALTMDDINFNLKTISINKALLRNNDGEWVVRPMTKNKYSHRIVTVPDFVLDELKSGCITVKPSYITKNFPRYVELAGLPPFSFHKLRHFFASQLMYAGVPQRTIERMGGWEPGSSVLSKIYQNVIESREREAQNEVVKLFGDVPDEYRKIEIVVPG